MTAQRLSRQVIQQIAKSVTRKQQQAINQKTR